MASVEATITVCTQREDFSLEAEISKLTQSRKDIGAVVGFVGICRDEDGKLAALELEHYPGMAEAEIKRIADTSVKRWDLHGLTVIHRYGKLNPGENIVLVVAASSHRQAAFDGANYMMDFLKTRAPFWKKEHLADGSLGEWVEARDEDDTAMERWEK